LGVKSPIIVFAVSADLLWIFCEKIAKKISNLHQKLPGKKLRRKSLVEILDSILFLDSEQQVSGFLAERFSPRFQY